LHVKSGLRGHRSLLLGTRDHDTTDISDGVTEVLCYGTAVFVEQAA